MRIRVIAPITNSEFLSETPHIYAEYARPETRISAVGLDTGPASVESFYEDALAAPQVIARALEAERDGVDAVIIDCMNDPGLEAAREAVSIPVVGAAQASMLMASILSHKFSVISTAARDVYPVELLVRRYGLKDKYASTRWVDIPVLDLGEDEGQLLAALTKESAAAILQDSAHAVVFGCTGMKGLAGRLQENLHARGLDAIVIDPSLAALKWAEMLVGMRMSHSRLTYPLLDEGTRASMVETPPVEVPEINGRNSVKPEVHVLVPVVRGFREQDWLDGTLDAYRSYAGPGTSVQIRSIQSGPETVETRAAEAAAVPGMLRLVRESEAQGATALVIDCMCDPSLDPAREAAGIPIVGPSQASAFLAASLAHRFSYLGTGSESRQAFPNQMEEYGISSKLASVRTTSLSVEELECDPKLLFDALVSSAEKAVLEDGAHILIPGCTGMIGTASKLQAALEERGFPVPVLEPCAVAVKMAEALSELKLVHSKLTWPKPPRKRLAGFSELEF
jgi:allantoin racemase